MTKSELISTVAKMTGIKKVEAEKVVKALISAVTDCLQKGDKLNLVGFGSFSTSKRATRKGHDPRTGKKITIPASIVAKFKPGKYLKEAVNNQ